MTKKQATPEAVEETKDSTPVENTAAPAPDVDWCCQSALQFALDHHRINGGMLTVAQIIENAKQFRDFIKGEHK